MYLHGMAPEACLGLGRAMSSAACCTCPRAASLMSATYRWVFVMYSGLQMAFVLYQQR